MPKESATTLSFPAELSFVTHLSYRLGDSLPIDYSSEIDGVTFNYVTDPLPLGAGCYGEVKKGILESTGQLVAIKRLHPGHQRAQHSFQPEFLPENLLKSEYDAFAQAHPQEQEYATCHYNQCQDIIVTPFISGKPISKDYTAAQWFNIFSQLTKQITQLHAEGITHGDFNGGNNVIVSYGKVRLIDFGLAAVQSDEKENEDKETDSSRSDDHIKFFITNWLLKLSLTDLSLLSYFDDIFYSEVILNLKSFLLGDKISIKSRAKPLYDFLSQDENRAKDFSDKIKKYILEEIRKSGKTSSQEVYESLAAILLKISSQRLSAKELKQFDIADLIWYLESLSSTIISGIFLIHKNPEFTALYNSLMQAYKSHMGNIFIDPILKGPAFTALERQNIIEAQSKTDTFKSELKNIARVYLTELLASDEIGGIINLVNHDHGKFFLFLLDFVPLQDRLDMLDAAYKKLMDKSVDKVELEAILKIYFMEYQQCAKLLDANLRAELIGYLRTNHTIPKACQDRFSVETTKHFEAITQERVQHFIDNPSKNTLVDFLTDCHRFYHDRNQLKKQIRQAMSIISHVFSSDPDEKSNETPQEQALVELRQSALITKNKPVRNSIYQAFLWIERSVPKFNDLNDVAARLSNLSRNSDFIKFKTQESEAVSGLKEPDQQKQFRSKATEMVQDRIAEINKLALLFTTKKLITEKKVVYLNRILTHLQLDEFRSLGEFLKPETLEIHYPELFQPRQRRFTFWEGQNEPQLTQTYKMFEELSASYGNVASEAPSITHSA